MLRIVLPLCEGNHRSPVDYPHIGAVMLSFDVCNGVPLNKPLKDLDMPAIRDFLELHYINAITNRVPDTRRADSRLAPSQWETVLLCNDASHWLGANLESALTSVYKWADFIFGESVMNDQHWKAISLLRKAIWNDILTTRWKWSLISIAIDIFCTRTDMI